MIEYIGVLTGPQIRDLFKCTEFEAKLAPMEKKTWECIANVCQNFLSTTRAPNYEQLVDEMIAAMHEMKCLMSLKIHLMHSHIDSFPIIQNEANDEQGEKFHQDIAYMEFRYKGKSKLRMLSDYCWNAIRDHRDTLFTRKRKMPFFSAPKPWLWLIHRTKFWIYIYDFRIHTLFCFRFMVSILLLFRLRLTKWLDLRFCSAW